MRVLIAISRRYPSLRAIGPILGRIAETDIAILGDNLGPEQSLILSLYANNPNVHQNVYHADWGRLHSAARSVRDAAMLQTADAVIAFTDGADEWGGTDRYLNQLIRRAIELALPVQVYDRNADALQPQNTIYDFDSQCLSV